MALVLVLGLMLMNLAFFQVAASGGKRMTGGFDDDRAFFLAEAGLHESFQALRGGGTGGIGSLDDPVYLGGGVLWVEATSLGNDQTRLVSTGLVGSGRQAVETVVLNPPEEDPLFVATLNSKETLTLNAGVMIDSYDSMLGSYASQAINTGNGKTYAGDNGDVRSNANIVLNAYATVFGDAIPGPGYGVAFNTGAYVSGSITPALEPFIFPPIVVPSFASSGALTVPVGPPQTLSSGDYDFTNLTINKDATLVVQGPANIVVDDFLGGKDAKLLIDATNGPVTFYVENTYTHTSGFEASPVTGSPMAVAFLVNGQQDVVFPSATKVRGGYYTPNANILFASGSECWGAFAANRIEMANDMKFHYDEALMRYWEEDTGQESSFQVLSWRPIPLPEDSAAPDPRIALLRADRRDPVLVLGLDRTTLLSPAQAWGMPQP